MKKLINLDNLNGGQSLLFVSNSSYAMRCGLPPNHPPLSPFCSVASPTRPTRVLVRNANNMFMTSQSYQRDAFSWVKFDFFDADDDDGVIMKWFAASRPPSNYYIPPLLPQPYTSCHPTHPYTHTHPAYTYIYTCIYYLRTVWWRMLINDGGTFVVVLCCWWWWSCGRRWR